MKHHDPHTDDLEREARKRVKQLKGFYAHLGSYVLVNSFLVCVNLLTSPHTIWPHGADVGTYGPPPYTMWAVWPMLGWGLGLASHAVSVFGLLGLGGKAWQERKVREFMRQRQHGLSAEQVRRLLREELQPDSHIVLSQAEWQAVLRRLENLETIITSKDWTFMERLSDADKASDNAPSSESKTGPNGVQRGADAQQVINRVPDHHGLRE